MERSLSSLAFRGSIVEAVAEAKLQKKLFVVYTAGDNPESKLLETSTWFDPKVVETLSKYCILLHILEGSADASNFSAIYPQYSVPCITALGYNGVQLWKNEGFVSADVLASSLEKAWLSLHVQETTAAFLSAALASRNQLAPGTSGPASSEQVTLETPVSTQSNDGDTLSSDVGQMFDSGGTEDRNNKEDVSEMTRDNQVSVPRPEPSVANVTDNGEIDGSISQIETESTPRNYDSQSDAKVAHPVSPKKLDSFDNCLGNNHEVSGEMTDTEVSQVGHVYTEVAKELEKPDASDSSAVTSNDVFLNIRLPDGSSLQAKFSMVDTLKMVKDYIIENQTSSLGSFSIAIPYPRKVFNDNDLDNILSELGLYNRQALVVVPHNKSNSHHRGGSTPHEAYSTNDANSSLNASEGYWVSVRRILSYVNPFSYLSRSRTSISSAQESQIGLREYVPDASLQNNAPRNGSSNQGTIPSSKSRQQTSRFGANIHTLQHNDDDESRFDNRNTFWNGNSTQFDGNDDEPK
ncbi:Plant UBX domain-containing protein 11 [Striga hermonthica]|uniref:Plant UBX domain-containing protein 11 n=1 Tax=Striga hermonthica TaxID=68872 RepID=A0A9N7RAX9_STRHE|nr:Plant UBX domain-containing protein 11 [Striga hermonthica]